jgi:ABC-2 type transport system permease protein
LTVLPQFAQLISYAVPLTWWLEGVRRALVPGSLSSVGGTGSLWTQLTGTAAPGSGQILVALLLTTAVTTLGALAAYRWSEHRAKERGLLDLTTGS